jgi:hypothetical protein
MIEWIKKFFTQNSNKRVAEEYSIPARVLTPKEIATEAKEPWVAVLSTNVNLENPRNGFFELDWNEYFIATLRQHGYTGVKDEELIDQWFGDLCKEIGNDEGLPMDRRWSGFIDIKNIGNGRSEVS